MIPTHSVKEIQRLFVYLRSLEVSVSVCINNNAKILSAQITDEAQTHADFNAFSSGYSSVIIRSHDEKYAELCCHLFYKVLVQLCQQRTRLICWTLCMLQPTEHLSLGITVQSTKLHPFSFIPQTSSLDHGVVPGSARTTHFWVWSGRGALQEGNRPKTAPAVPDLNEQWWELTGQLPRQGPLKWCLGTYERISEESFPSY